MFQRIVGVFALKRGTFEEIEHDPHATGQAALVVLLAAVFIGLGSGFTNLFGSASFSSSFVKVLVWTFLYWLIWSVITYFVGTSSFGGKADLSQMLRVIGFSFAPLMLGIIPCIGIVGILWAFAAGFVAVRQGLDIDNNKTLVTVIVGIAVYLIGWLILSGVTGGIRLFLS